MPQMANHIIDSHGLLSDVLLFIFFAHNVHLEFRRYSDVSSKVLLGLFDQAVVLGMGTDPEPDRTVIALDSESAISATDANRPEATDFLHVK